MDNSQIDEFERYVGGWGQLCVGWTRVNNSPADLAAETNPNTVRSI